MKYLLGLICLFFVQKWDAFDRWLCWKLPWYLRLSWCSLWVRRDEFHPSLDSDYSALLEKQLFRRKWLKVWIDVTRLSPSTLEEYFLRLKKLDDRLYVEYTDSLVRRRDIAHERDIETPSLS